MTYWGGVREAHGALYLGVRVRPPAPVVMSDNGKVRWEEMSERLATQEELEQAFADSLRWSRQRRALVEHKREERKKSTRLFLLAALIVSVVVLVFYVVGGIAILVEGLD